MKRKTPNAVQTRTRSVRVWDGRDGLLKEGQNSLQGAGGARPRKRVQGRRRATLDDGRLLMAGCFALLLSFLGSPFRIVVVIAQIRLLREEHEELVALHYVAVFPDSQSQTSLE
ncbi:hypothetical protein WR25_23485 [Diploscapter pachys]|uniref:Uncharacterized protein n=1 Tax=Diploscapter pachys TaxID=2018661 RepID=A0A2A2L910_9BILA|nr:hypothetical protein WR25_23485 [Diploscapter pachys]